MKYFRSFIVTFIVLSFLFSICLIFFADTCSIAHSIREEFTKYDNKLINNIAHKEIQNSLAGKNHVALENSVRHNSIPLYHIQIKNGKVFGKLLQQKNLHEQTEEARARSGIVKIYLQNLLDRGAQIGVTTPFVSKFTVWGSKFSQQLFNIYICH